MSATIPPRPDLPAAPLPVARARDGDGGRPRATWRWWEAILVYLTATAASSVLTLPVVDSIQPQGVATLVGSAAIAVLNTIFLAVWLSLFHKRALAAIGWPARTLRELGAGVVAGLVLYPVVVFGAGIVIALLLEALAGATVRPPDQIPPNLNSLGVATSVLYALAIAPVHEELFFRGILYRSLADRYGFAVAATGSGLVFGLIHYIPGSWEDSTLLISVMVVTGFALAWIYRRRGNLLATVAAHATFNAVGLALIYSLR